ncbi:hypothetical protein HYH02_000686 [Chlamydomonas schloesseri]|uniref:Uncharacterized protein n=1 Tax=Chlamydomonas schloesseri TaxID=2026947 RepID=A0A836BDK6_9CHLO|nr:hypothetical protein HYH02_000686 [Chlamydomonas schloesseri]|eukprot:KAG2454854.1 hypothetical protein HYH02_000686 [Chlamydomonas schloesseri]
MEENLKLRRQLAEMQRQLTLTQTAQRRGEAEAARLRTSLARAEEMMGQREAGTLSPNSMASQLYRTPETTSLVAALRQRLEDCEAGREDLRRELERMAKSTRATAVAELQAEVQACSEETGRQLARAELLAGRTAAATAEVVELRRQLAEQAAAHAAAQVRLEEETQCLHDQPGRTGAAAGHGRHHHSSSSSGPSTLCSPPRVNRRDGPETEAVSSKVASGGGGGDSNRLAAANAAATLAELETCAEVLLSHAHLINARVPLGPAHRGSMAMLEAWVRNRGPQVAGAPAVLRTLRAHQGRLHAALVALPGGPIFTNASLAALTVLAAQAAAQPVADAPEPGQGDDGEHSNSERGQQRQQQLGKAGVEPQTPQPRAHPISRVASTRGGGTGPTQPHGQVSPTKGAAVAGHSPSLACAPPPAPPFPPQQRQPPLAVPRLKLPNAGGSSGLPWIPPSVVEEEPEEVESLDSVPTAATPAQTHAEVGSSPRAAHGVGSVGAASPIGGGAGRLPSGRVDNRSKYDVIRSRQQQHLMEPVPLSQEPGVTGGSGGEAHTAIVAARGVEAISTDDSWQELGVEEVDEDLDGDY